MRTGMFVLLAEKAMSFCLATFFFFNDTATTEIYTLSLHDALPISPTAVCTASCISATLMPKRAASIDRKSTRLNSSHVKISYAVFCLKKKNLREGQQHLAEQRSEMGAGCGHGLGRTQNCFFFF